jgi:hydrogenase maturation factor
MATKKKITHKRDATRELIVLVPSMWGLSHVDLKNLKAALDPVARENIHTTHGPICCVCGVTNGNGD